MTPHGAGSSLPVDGSIIAHAFVKCKRKPPKTKISQKYLVLSTGKVYNRKKLGKNMDK